MARYAIWIEEDSLEEVSGHLGEWLEADTTLPAVIQDIYNQVVEILDPTEETK